MTAAFNQHKNGYSINHRRLEQKIRLQEQKSLESIRNLAGMKLETRYWQGKYLSDIDSYPFGLTSKLGEAVDFY